MQDMFTFLSQFAQSWALAGMAVFFALAMLWLIRPGSKKAYDEAANSIFRNDTQPQADASAQGDGKGA
jgi:cytochrome c oxidase cbb3-type subunit IV